LKRVLTEYFQFRPWNFSFNPVLEFLNRQNARKIGIILTDGRSTSPTSTINAANTAKAAGVELFSIGYGTDVFV
jgi:predicted homoserine dehydrogenase-like protein